jgi:hypothetical protein
VKRYSPVTPRHIPALLPVPVEERMRADSEFALDELDACTLASSLVARSLGCRCMLQSPLGAFSCVTLHRVFDLKEVDVITKTLVKVYAGRWK